MKLRNRELVTILVIVLSLPLLAGEKKPVGKVVDAGSFGIFVSGRRVATEKFQIEQQPGSSVATSELSVNDGQLTARQSSELRLAANGDVQRYTWRELSPGKGETVVEPKDEFLVEHILPGGSEKAEDQPFILTPSTAILDDYFFSHRQILTWRYVANACGGQAECKLARAEFPVLIPRQRTSARVNLEYAGREKITVGGAERELDRFNLQVEDSAWAMWFDQDHKLIRILIASDKVEVLRD